jgi:hypothetical protein
MSRTKFSEATAMWVLGRVFRPIAGRRWAGLRSQAREVLTRDNPRRCLIGHGAVRDHAVCHLMAFQSICGQPVNNITGGDLPGDIDCWTCLRMLNRAGRAINKEHAQEQQEAA